MKKVENRQTPVEFPLEFSCGLLLEKTGQMHHIWCIMYLEGAVSTLIFPDWLRYPTLNFMNLHGFIVHGLLILIPITLLCAGIYQPDIRRIYQPVGFLAVTSLIMYQVNLLEKTNFMFLNGPSWDSPFLGIYQSYGYGGYMIVYITVVVLVILLMYGISGIIRKVV